MIGTIDLKKAEKFRQFTRVLRVLFKEFRGFFLCLAGVFVVSCCILYFVYPREDLPHQRMTWLQTVYYTWMMIFFQNPLPFIDHWLVSSLFFSLPVVGMVTIAEGVVHLGNLLFQRKRYSKEWQKMIATTYEDHIVVCGLGNVGVRVVKHLTSLGESVVAIENSPHARFIKEVESLNIPVVVSDARDKKLAKQVEKSLGLDGAYSSSARSSRLFAQAAISENILDSFEFGGTTINAYQLIVKANTLMVGAAIDEIRHKYEVTVLLQEKQQGELDWNPSPNNVLEVGDRLLIMTDRDGIKRLGDATRPLSLPTKHHD
jgi:voltage-gated potassium channel